MAPLAYAWGPSSHSPAIDLLCHRQPSFQAGNSLGKQIFGTLQVDLLPPYQISYLIYFDKITLKTGPIYKRESIILFFIISR